MKRRCLLSENLTGYGGTEFNASEESFGAFVVPVGKELGYECNKCSIALETL